MRRGSRTEGGPSCALTVDGAGVRPHSLKLIKGSIDQVNSIADIHWVQPRVLDSAQIEALAGRLDEWTERVGRVEGVVGAYRREGEAVAA